MAGRRRYFYRAHAGAAAGSRPVAGVGRRHFPDDADMGSRPGRYQTGNAVGLGHRHRRTLYAVDAETGGADSFAGVVYPDGTGRSLSHGRRRSYIFNASFALGAFLGGMVVGKSHVSHQAGAELIPLRDAFAILFFLSVGMLFDPQFLIERPVVVIVSLLIVVLIKPLVTVIVVAVLGYSPTTAFTVAASLAQVGEFSFILAQRGIRCS